MTYKPFDKPRKLSSLSNEELDAIDPTSLQLSLMLSMLVESCYLAGVPKLYLLDAVEKLYEAIAEEIKLRAN